MLKLWDRTSFCLEQLTNSLLYTRDELEWLIELPEKMYHQYDQQTSRWKKKRSHNKHDRHASSPTKFCYNIDIYKIKYK